MLSKVNRLLFVVVGVMLLGGVGVRPLLAQVSPQPDGWQTLKFGMTPRQTCAAMNKAGIGCTVLCAEKSTSGQCKSPEVMTYVNTEPVVSISNEKWMLSMEFVDNVGRVFRLAPGGPIDVGRLTRIGLHSSGCDKDAIIHALEYKYGTFAQAVDTAVKQFANGAWIVFEKGMNRYRGGSADSCDIFYNAPLPPPPLLPTGHF